MAEIEVFTVPTYDYLCSENGQVVEVFHPISEVVTNWGELCSLSGQPLGRTSPQAPVHKIVSAPGLAFPKSNSDLMSMGFSKLVKREKGVYENVTAREGERRIVKAED